MAGMCIHVHDNDLTFETQRFKLKILQILHEQKIHI